jgi:hypothetical protein
MLPSSNNQRQRIPTLMQDSMEQQQGKKNEDTSRGFLSDFFYETQRKF